jgi:hypothetical protein
VTTIHERLEVYIADILGWAAALGDEPPGNLLRVEVFQILRELAFISLNPYPVPSLVDLVHSLRASVVNRMLAESYQDAPAGQVVFRYKTQVARDIESILARCGEEVLP